jgi:hypothetical protein
MRTLTNALATEQRRATALPAVTAIARQFSHPAKAALVQPGIFGWTQLYSGSEAPGLHACAMAADDALIRVRIDENHLKWQRVASPGPTSDFSVWQTMVDENLTAYLITGAVAVAAKAGEIWLICNAWIGNPQAYKLVGFYSEDNCQSWTMTIIAEPQTVALSAAFKADGTLAVAYADEGEANLGILFPLKTGGVSANSEMTYPPLIVSLALYHDGDWNIIALVDITDLLYLSRIVYGDGYRATAGNWSGSDLLNTGSATANQFQLIQQYWDKPPAKRFPLTYQYRIRAIYDRAPARTTKDGKYFVFGGYPRVNPWQGFNAKDPLLAPASLAWYNLAVIAAARSVDNLNLDAPFICKPAGAPPILSVYKNNEKWFFRLKPGTDFYDSNWSKSYALAGSCIYGMALCCDSTYIYGTRNNEVWRSRLPYTTWDVPAAGEGASSEYQEIPETDILPAEEGIEPLRPSRLEITLDNSQGQYSTLPTTHINKGSQVEFTYGYRTPSKETPGGNRYFIEDWQYDRSPNKPTVVLQCIDAWALLEEYTIPAPHEFNMMSNEYTVYDLIERVLGCVGATLTYKSRSTDITTFYPQLEVMPGETGAGFLTRLLALVPDLIFFNGLDAYIVYPQTTDAPVYEYHFPEVTQ